MKTRDFIDFSGVFAGVAVIDIEKEAMYVSLFYSSICRGVNEFGLGFGFVWPEAKESHFFLLYWLTKERSTDNATEIEKPMFYSQLILSEWL